MSDPKDQDSIDDRFEAFLDGGLSPEERAEVMRAMETDSDLAEQAALQERIDDSLQRLFAAPENPPQFLQDAEALLATIPQADEDFAVEVSSSTGTDKIRRSRWSAAVLAVAACVAWLTVGAQLLPRHEPVVAKFEPRPLNDLYSQCVEEGFKPYWVCDDEELFARTFETRQGIPLKLGAMPEGTRMVGLSYLSGISRKSTSLLAMVNNVPVIVFVDKLKNDWKPETGRLRAAGLSVTRTEKHGLVFYEVSPLDEPRVTSYLLVAQ